MYGKHVVSKQKVKENILQFKQIKNKNGFYACGEERQKACKDEKVIPWELQHKLVAVDVNNKTVKNE